MKMKNVIVIFYAPPIHPASCEKNGAKIPILGSLPVSGVQAKVSQKAVSVLKRVIRRAIMSNNFSGLPVK